MSDPAARKIEFPCPICGKDKANVAYRGSGDIIIGCFTDSCKAMGGAYLQEVAEAYNLPRNAAKCEIAQAIVEDEDSHERRVGPPPPLPTHELAIRWGVRLRRGCPASAWLRTYRRLSLGALRDARVGWDPQRRLIVLPFFLGGSIVAFKTCAVGDKLHKPGGSGAWAWPLYPEPQREHGWTWLVEGEWDALRLRSIGLPAVSVHNGKGTRIDPAHGEQLQGLYVRVMYDVGAEPEAIKAVRRLRRYGVNARHYPARLLGLTEKNQDVSDYLDNGGDPTRLCRRGRTASN